MTLNEQAAVFWASNSPAVRAEYVPGFASPVYSEAYSDLEPAEKQKVRDMMKSTRE